ncbi:MAG: glycosyltransferase [Paenibacillus macerans]|uniref:Glycosyl transferase 2 family protein n=1 Tax=Paenibacillus macerans TaxID=44252 RepID=A0A090ZLL7_PAEMA|nr:glycosyltransferase [Paenibacillus macerans]KFN12279.1 glycosyl transferase 2 family protein [Paenibacillus macerans]MCY7561226.1 glycosyltransferase [Paenibacillus macerans]MDU7474386.1 glycosyltransferase [Paenibacillus macerans]MEC0150208.1 glycosyltransferase [Paenibacillus macerans]MEC0329494.1 glycosyltransferase [Paenibacillus macerans]
MITISLCMIVKNEEAAIGRCLETAADLVDEIVIVDTGSTDDTKSVVSRFTSQFYTFNWVDDFAAARNYAFEQATMDFILWLDADDVIEPADRDKLRELKQTLDPNADSVTMLYHLSKDEYGNVTFSLRRNRLVRRSRNFRWIGPVHEYLEVGGHTVHSDIAITHLSKNDGKDSDRNLKIYERRLSVEEELTPRDIYYYANELKDHGFHRKAIRYYETFLNGGKGWIEDNISACGKLADCYHALGDRQSELEATLRSLQYDHPRAEFCCRLGYHFLNEQNYKAAIFWYRSAIQAKPEDDHLGFANPAFWTWLPHLQLSVCYDRIGKYELASQHNELALHYRPEDPRMLKNREYFRTRLEQPLEAAAGGMSS